VLEIIDVPSDVTPFADRLALAGIKTIIRYYNHSNSSALPTKCLSRPELAALHAAGLSVAVVFEQRGGAGGHLADLTQQSGTDDGERAHDLATRMSQPAGSAIYFAVDFDFFRNSELSQIGDYFAAAKQALRGDYLVGVYGSGTVGRTLKRRGLVDHVWLAGATGWSGTRDALAAGEWSIFQKQLASRSDIGGFTYDGNVINPSLPNFGQFGPASVQDTPRGSGSAALFRVTARSGLNLRLGPGENFRVAQTVPVDSIVTGLDQDGAWMKVDVNGDGQADGFMFASFLQAVSGGLPVPVTPVTPAGTVRPIDVARAELALGVREIAGPQDNPRIVMYHRTTGGAAHDEVAWCSSFVNYCVEQAGLRGTDSKAALSWHQAGWGRDVTANPAEGDVVVFSRHPAHGDPGGHVGFFIDAEPDTVRVLGGNQGNAISIARFPKNGVLGTTRFTLLSIRRG
jgi:uncharacterized protein (TIGR02594 family)